MHREVPSCNEDETLLRSVLKYWKDWHTTLENSKFQQTLKNLDTTKSELVTGRKLLVEHTKG